MLHLCNDRRTAVIPQPGDCLLYEMATHSLEYRWSGGEEVVWNTGDRKLYFSSPLAPFTTNTLLRIAETIGGIFGLQAVIDNTTIELDESMRGRYWLARFL